MTKTLDKFMSIHTHTKTGSSRDALLSVPDLFEFCKKNNINGTITDHGTIASWAEALTLKEKYPEVKIALGIEAYTNYNRERLFFLKTEIKKRKAAKDQSIELKMLIEEFEEIKKYNHLVILAKNQHGLHNIIQLNNQAYRNFYDKPLITHTELFDLPKDKNGDRGLIVTSSCLAGVVPQFILKDKDSNAFEMTGIFKEEFRDDYYLELQINGMDIQKKVNSKLIEFSKKLKIPTIISTDAHYASDDYNRAHEIFLLIQGNQKVSDLGKTVYKVHFENKKGEIKKKKFDPSEEFRGIKVSKFKIGDKFSAKEKIKKSEEKFDLKIKNIEEVNKVWTIETNLILRNEKDLADSRKQLKHEEITPQMLKDAFSHNTEIGNKIDEALDINRDVKLPRFENEDETLKKEIAKGLIRIGRSKDSKYIERAKHEMKVIIECGFASYFLILWDLFKYLRSEEIGVGSGRGCVFSGNSVLTSNGLKPIEDIKIGDFVLTHTNTFKEVENHFTYEVDEEIYFFETKSSSNVFKKISGITGDHEIYVQTREDVRNGNNIKKWVEAKDLIEGDFIIDKFEPSSNNLTLSVIKNIEKKQIKGNVYDLQVKEDSSYNIDGLIVHNSSCGSLVAYLLQITRIDPLDIEQYGEGLVFERFLDYGRSGKNKKIKITLENGSEKTYNIQEEIEILRDKKKLKILAQDLKETDEIIN
jgi:DNA polymerase III alpha subunit